MIALVDTSVWTLSLRRSRSHWIKEALELGELVREGGAAIIGPVRQVLLSGVRVAKQFELLRDHLWAFPDIELTTEDFELAADFFNRCLRRGVQASNPDFLICAVAAVLGFSVFTTDADFASFSRHIPLVLHVPRS